MSWLVFIFSTWSCSKSNFTEINVGLVINLWWPCRLCTLHSTQFLMGSQSGFWNQSRILWPRTCRTSFTNWDCTFHPWSLCIVLPGSELKCQSNQCTNIEDLWKFCFLCTWHLPQLCDIFTGENYNPEHVVANFWGPDKCCFPYSLHVPMMIYLKRPITLANTEGMCSFPTGLQHFTLFVTICLMGNVSKGKTHVSHSRWSMG